MSMAEPPLNLIKRWPPAKMGHLRALGPLEVLCLPLWGPSSLSVDREVNQLGENTPKVVTNKSLVAEHAETDIGGHRNKAAAEKRAQKRESQE